MEMPIVKNLMDVLPEFYRLFNVICWIIGAVLVYVALMQAYTVSNGRTQQGVGAPITTFLVAIAILFLPSTWHALSETFFAGQNYSLLAYAPPRDNKSVAELILRVVEFIGAIGVLKGLLTAKAVGDGNSKEGGVGRAITYMVGGVLALNITTFGPMLASFVGLDLSWILPR